MKFESKLHTYNVGFFIFHFICIHHAFDIFFSFQHLETLKDQNGKIIRKFK